MIDYEREIQLGLFNTDSGLSKEIIKLSDRVRTGSKAEEVFREVIAQNPDICAFSFLIYTPLPTSGENAFENSEPIWVSVDALKDKNLLINLSNAVIEQSSDYTGFIDSDEEEIVLHDGIAICSLVRMRDGTVKHIPLIDFDNELDSDPVVIDDMKMMNEAILSLGQNGYLLDSGNSSHFWGVNLMAEEEWKRFMSMMEVAEFYDEDGYEHKVFDKGFVIRNSKRGYSALRIYEYPPLKDFEPEVTMIIG